MKRGNRRGVGGLVAACMLVSLLVVACGRTPPEQRLREQLSSMQQALEQRRAGDFMDGVAADFGGEQGMDRAALQQAVRAQVLANANIGLTLGPAQVEMHGDRATVTFSAMATGGSGRFLPDSAQAWDVTTAWRDQDGQWRLYYAQWAPR